MDFDSYRFSSHVIAESLWSSLIRTKIIYNRQISSIVNDLEEYLGSRDVLTTADEALIVYSQLIEHARYRIPDDKFLVLKENFKNYLSIYIKED